MTTREASAMSPRPIIIDCDPGQDDALAILLALASPEELEVLAITAVAGNVPLALTEKNARKIVELAGRPDIPVHAGCDRPLRRAMVTAEHVHGRTGLDGAELPEPKVPLADAHAVDVIIAALRARPGAVTLCPLGPLTNIATAIQRAPDVVDHIDQIVLMGGAIGEGNITPAAEFNIFADPHAAEIVFESGVRITMLGLDVTHQVLATPERVRAIAAPSTAVSRTITGLLEFYNIFDQTRRNRPGAPMHDPCVIAYLLRPELFAGRDCHVAIETVGKHTLGRTVVDWSGRGVGRPNASVIDQVDAEGFFTLLTERLARL
jgi:purine nucleosidase